MNHSATHSSYWPLIAAACALALGCASDPETLGDGEVTTDKAQLASYAATWTGYVEAYRFQSGTDKLTITLDASGNGTVRVGDGAILRPPTDPDIGYPEALRQALAEQGEMPEQTHSFYDGIEYPVSGTHLQSERIRFTFDSLSAFTEWCAMQAALPNPTTIPLSYSCEPYAAGTNDDGTCAHYPPESEMWVPTDCSRIALCQTACSCDANSCTTRAPRPTELDAALDNSGDKLSGTLLDGGQPHTIRLQRSRGGG